MTEHAKDFLTIHWVVGGLEGDEASGHTSRLASTRYRAIIPVRELRAMGHRVELIDVRRWRWDSRQMPDVVVVGKLLRYGSDQDFLRHCDKVFAQMTRAREAGVSVVADFCDDHFDHPLLGGPWRWLARQAVLCTAASQQMADAVSKHTASPVAVVGDPLASPASEARVFVAERGLHRFLARWLPKVFKKRLRLVWFGHPNNFPPMARWAEELVGFAAERPMTLTLVTGPNGDDTRPVEQIQEWIDAFNLANAPRIIVSFEAWNEKTQWQAASQADVVLIPSSVQKADVNHKSINRLADALNAGRYVVASAVPSYRPFDAYCSLTEEPAKALQWMIQNLDQALAMVTAGRDAVQRLASVACITEKWVSAFSSGMEANQTERPNDGLAPSTVADPHQQTSTIRLNLGCGDKILPGYINVDVAPSRSGRQPDVICDLRDLSTFADNSVDEVMAIHVVEHFWRWEIEGVLREWVRVIKPGGLMVIECPNLITACELFIQDPEKYSSDTNIGQRTMWVFYGDPAWRDPLMVHRWGYTPSSLAAMLRKVGLINVKQQPAEFKLREPRDMRVIGQKI